MLFRTRVFAPENGSYVIRTEGVTPDRLWIDHHPIQTSDIELKKGWHELMALFEHTSTQSLNMARHIYLDPRPRSAIVLLPAADSSVLPITPTPTSWP